MVKRHSLLRVAQNLSKVNWNSSSSGGGYQQGVFLTGLKDSFAGAQERGGSAGTTALVARSTYYYRVNLTPKIRRQSYLLIFHGAKLQYHRECKHLILVRILTLGNFIPFGGIDALESIQSITNSRISCTSRHRSHTSLRSRLPCNGRQKLSPCSPLFHKFDV